MALNQYIGARYVPLITGDWNPNKTYEPLSIVLYEGSSYTSICTVPAGIVPTDATYWAKTGDYNAQVEQYRQEVKQVQEDMTELEANAIHLTTHITLKVMPNAFTGEGVTTGANWTFTNGVFTHTGGSAEPVTVILPVVTNNFYVVKFNTSTHSNISDFSVSLGGYLVEDTYKGDNEYYWVMLPTNGNTLVITPNSDFAGSIFSLSVQQINPNGTETIKLYTSNIGGGNISEYDGGYWNIGIGDDALSSNYSGRSNLALGHQALPRLDKNNQNIAIGTFSLQNLTDGYRNIGVGCDSMEFLQTGNNNVAIGQTALGGYTSINSGNVAVGNGALFGKTPATVSDNTAIGMGCAFNVTGNKNVFVGQYAGNGKKQSTAPLINANKCVFIGAETEPINEENVTYDGDVNINEILKISSANKYMTFGSNKVQLEGTFNIGTKVQVNDSARSAFVQLASTINESKVLGGLEFVNFNNSNADANTRRLLGSIIVKNVEGSAPNSSGGSLHVNLKAPNGGVNEKMTIINNSVGVGVTNPSANLHLSKGYAGSGNAPLKFTSGAMLSTPENGAVEYNGRCMTITNDSGTRGYIQTNVSVSANDCNSLNAILILMRNNLGCTLVADIGTSSSAAIKSVISSPDASAGTSTIYIKAFDPDANIMEIICNSVGINKLHKMYIKNSSGALTMSAWSEIITS